MRLFTALDLPETVRDRFTDLQTPGAMKARWTPSAQFHITVRFIGDASPEHAERYEAALSGIHTPPAACVPYGLDVLPSRRNPSVLVVGLERTDTLMALYHAVSDTLEAEGLAPEDRTYRPHVTLARLDDRPETIHTFLQENDDLSLPSFTSEALHLYESTLTPDGAVHERRASVPLRKQAGSPS